MRAKVTLTTIFVMTVLATLVWQTDTEGGQVVTDGLISYWSFDRTSITGETAEDVWGDNHGTIVGRPNLSMVAHMGFRVKCLYEFAYSYQFFT